MKHTQTPWLVDMKYGDNGGQARVIRNARWEYALSETGSMSGEDAAYIVRAVNAHEGLVRALQVLVDADKWWGDNKDSPKSALNHYQWAAEQARAALSAAKE